MMNLNPPQIIHVPMRPTNHTQMTIDAAYNVR